MVARAAGSQEIACETCLGAGLERGLNGPKARTEPQFLHPNHIFVLSVHESNGMERLMSPFQLPQPL
jgi:hypothetical protein